MKRPHAVILAVVIVLGGFWLFYNSYVGSTGDADLSGQNETIRDVPANRPGMRQNQDPTPGQGN